MGWSAAAMIIGSIASSSATSSAASKGVASQEKMFGIAREDLTPAREAGYKALEQLDKLMTDPSSITSTPGYEFALEQGLGALERTKAGGGKLFSGETLKDITRYGQDYATNQLDVQYNRLMGIAGLGTGAAQQTAQQAGYVGKGLADIYQWEGESQAQMYSDLSTAGIMYGVGAGKAPGMKKFMGMK